MKRLLLLTLVLMVATTVASAASMCTSDTLANLILEGSCESQGMLFTFTAGSFSSTGGLLASDVNASLQASHPGSLYANKWIFSTPTNGDTFVAGFTLSYTVSIVQGNAQGVHVLVQTVDQMDAGVTGGTNTVTASDTENLGIMPNPILMNALSDSNETKHTNPYAETLVTTNTIVNIPAGKYLLTYSQNFYGSTVPEPVTFVLIGSGLIGLTFLRRRFRKS